MPSITSYSPYEALAFFQCLVRHGANASTLQNISTSLKQNEYIRDNAKFDPSRLAPDALQDLYDEYVVSGQGHEKQSAQINGDSTHGERSPKRRKLSDSSKSHGATSVQDEHFLQELVDRLYTKYKSDVIHEIRRDEDVFIKLQDEIVKLEQQLETTNKEKAQLDVVEALPARPENVEGDTQRQKSLTRPDVVETRSKSTTNVQDAKQSKSEQTNSSETVRLGTPNSQNQDGKFSIPGEGVILRPQSNQQPKVSQSSPSTVGQHQSSGTLSRQQSSPSHQRAAYGPIQAQPAYPSTQPPPNHVAPQVSNASQRGHPRGQQISNQGRGSPIPYQGQQHPYPQYPQYPPPQWHPHMPQPYPQHPPYGPPTQYYPQPANSRHPHTPQQMPYVSYPHTASVPYLPQQQWRNQQWPTQPASTVSTPVSRPASRLSLAGSASSTPWKRKQTPNQLRTRSPTRPEREVSPLTDREESPPPTRSVRVISADTADEKGNAAMVQRQSKISTQCQSVTPSVAVPSRSQSVTSIVSDVRNEKYATSRRSQKIKAEPLSTPLPVASSDTEQRSTGRRGRPRSGTLTSQVDGLKTTAAKRKRDSISTSPTLSPQPSFITPPTRRLNQVHDPSLIIVSKNFGKTSQLLLNEITSHKLAGIFAKPLSERDAPGYKDLILRPQDLKSIKAAISKGSRAALAAIESIEGDQEGTPAKLLNPAMLARPGPIGNGFYLVQKATDLVPPKGIVNSAQLEMELARMFANAVMFNPLPSSERGFGKSLRLRRNGGDVVPKADPEETSASEESENGSLAGTDEGGIIADAREMFHDIIEIVGKWRELEGERMGSGTDTTASRHGSLAVPMAINAENARHASVSATSGIGEDDAPTGEGEVVSTPVPNTSSGPGRKRRKLIDH